MKSYMISIEGSGTIRFTAWLYYIFGNLFLSPKARILFDTVKCQSQFVTANAYTCVFPYMFRLQGMRLVTMYFNVLNLRTPEKARDLTSRQVLGEEIYDDVVVYLQMIAGMVLLSQLEGMDWDPLRQVADKGMMLQLCAMTFYTYMMLRNRTESIRKTLMMPRRNAVGKSTLQTVDAVRQWAESQGLRDSQTSVRQDWAESQGLRDSQTTVGK
jgi:hypothetical protein